MSLEKARTAKKKFIKKYNLENLKGFNGCGLSSKNSKYALEVRFLNGSPDPNLPKRFLGFTVNVVFLDLPKAL